MEWDAIFGGIVIFFIGVLLNKVRDWWFVRKNRDGSYDARYRRGSWIATILKLMGVLMTANGIFHFL